MLEVGSFWNGGIAQYAKMVFNKGEASYGDSEYEYMLTDDDFLFEVEDGKYTLIAYCGEETTVTLPDGVSGEEYDIYLMSGVINLVVPKEIKRIGAYTFSMWQEWGTLEKVSFEDSDAFWAIVDPVTAQIEQVFIFTDPVEVAEILILCCQHLFVKI